MTDDSLPCIFLSTLGQRKNNELHGGNSLKLYLKSLSIKSKTYIWTEPLFKLYFKLMLFFITKYLCYYHIHIQEPKPLLKHEQEQRRKHCSPLMSLRDKMSLNIYKLLGGQNLYDSIMLLNYCRKKIHKWKILYSKDKEANETCNTLHNNILESKKTFFSSSCA